MSMSATTSVADTAAHLALTHLPENTQHELIDEIKLPALNMAVQGCPMSQANLPEGCSCRA
jgi:hypothetical protein